MKKLLFNLFSNRPDERWNDYWIRRNWRDYLEFLKFARRHQLWSPETSTDDQPFISRIATEFLGVKSYTDIKYAIWLRT